VTETGYRRYGIHDLLRRYGRDHAAAGPDHDQALGRLLDYYQYTAASARTAWPARAAPARRLPRRPACPVIALTAALTELLRRDAPRPRPSPARPPPSPTSGSYDG
jgi:hypothetical protein